MAKRYLRSAVLLACALSLMAPAGRLRAASIKKEMKFAVELAEKGLWNEASHRFLALLKRSPHNPRLWNDLAVAYEAMGRYDEAHEAYEKAVKFAVNPPTAMLSNHEAFGAFYRTWQNPSTVEPPPLDDPRTAGAARPSAPATPVFPGPNFDDASAGDEDAEEAEEMPPSAPDDDTSAEDSPPLDAPPDEDSPPLDAPSDEEGTARDETPPDRPEPPV